MNDQQLINMAKQHDWILHDIQENIGLISFVKIIDNDQARINVYITKMTVGSCINHPSKGKTQLFRKNVDQKLMNKIFKNPRIHTCKGYHTK